MLWKRGSVSRRARGLLPRDDSVVSVRDGPLARTRAAAAIKWRGAHKYKSYGIVLLLVDAPDGRDPGKQLSAHPPRGSLAPHNAAKFGLAKRCTATGHRHRGSLAFESPARDVSCRPDEEKKPSPPFVALVLFLSFSLLLRERGSGDISVRVRFLHGDSSSGARSEKRAADTSD